MEKLKKVLRIISVVLVAFILIMIATGYFFEDEIKDLTVKTLNRNLKSEIKVGDINFSMLKSFPYASVEFANVHVAGSNKQLFDKKPLLEAKSVRLLFSLMNLFNKDYSIKKIVLTDATVNILTNKNGFTNYDILRTDTTSGAEIKFEIELFEIANTSFHQQSALSKFEQDFIMHKGQASGNFSASQYTLQIAAEVLYNTLSVDRVSYLKDKETKIETGISINNNSKIYTIKESKLQVADFAFTASGNVDNSGEEPLLNLSMHAADADAKNFISLLPKEVLPTEFFNYSFNGNVNVEATVIGHASKITTPAIAIKFATAKTDIIPSGKEYALRNVSMQGIYTNKKSSTSPVSWLQIKNFSAMLEGKPVRANIEIEKFSKPAFSVQLDGEFSLPALQRYVRMDTLLQVEGTINIHGSCKGIGNNTKSYKSSGTLRINDVSFKFKHKPLLFQNINGYFIFNGNDVTINNFSAQVGSSDLICTGTITNLFAYLFQQNQTAAIDLIATSTLIDMNELMADDISAKDDTLYRLDFPKNISADVKINAAKVMYGKFIAQNAKGNLSLQNKELSTNSLLFNAVDGSVYLQGSIDASQPDSLFISCDASVKKLNIQKLFYQMGNFNQTMLIDKNINGSVTATVQVATMWSKAMHVSSNKIYAKSNITIENGELINFTPMLKLSKFVKGSDLRNIKFSTIKNDIEIRNRKIYFPRMEINSTALNIVASGVHDFDNVVDYKIQMRMSQLMGNKVKQQNTEFGTIEDDGLGGLKLFLTMTGPVDNPKFAYDRKSVEQNIVKTVQQEKKNFINIIKDEFKGNKIKTDSVKNKKEELQIEED